MDINISVYTHIGEHYSSIDVSATEVTVEDVDRVTSALWVAVKNLSSGEGQ